MGRTYYSELSFSLRAFDAQPGSFVADQLSLLQYKSKKSRLLRGDCDEYLAVLKMLLNYEPARELLFRPTNKIGRKDIYQLFLMAEQLIAKTDRTAEVKTKASSSFRKYVFDCAKEQVLKDDDVSRRSVGFQTSLNHRPPPRPLISDVTDHSLDPELAAPVSALAHLNAKDLVAKTQLRLETDLLLIRDACLRQLEVCKALRERLIALGKEKCSREVLKSTADSMNSSDAPRKKTQEFLSKVPTEVLFTAYQKIFARDGLAKVERAYAPYFWRNNDRINDFLHDEEKYLANAGFRIHFMPYRMISQELVASFVLLLTYSGWNSSTLRSMSADDVVVNGDWITLKGYKGKIDRHVDDVHLDAKQPGVKMALDLISWNRKQLIKLGFLPGNSKLLWCTWANRYGVIEHQYMGFQNALSLFQKAYSLPNFSLDQLRPQVMAYEALKTKNPDRVRQLASHKSLTTTGHYLDQILMRNMNSAINLEFQRRLENTVLFHLAEKDGAYRPLVRVKHVDLRLLTPLGDGGSCANPAEPPDERFLIGNICDGRRCHVDKGCNNRRVVIDVENLVALVRKRRYYKMNWRRLEAKNSVAFEKFHVPAILFNLGLYDYIKSSSYRHHLLRIERETENENR